MERLVKPLKPWFAEIMGTAASFLCWFTPEHCNYVATFIAMMIGLVTFFFITIPKALPNIKLAVNAILRKKE